MRHAHSSIMPGVDNGQALRDSKSAFGLKGVPVKEKQKDWQPPIRIDTAGTNPSDHLMETYESKPSSNRKILTGSSFYKTMRDKSEIGGKQTSYSPSKDIVDNKPELSVAAKDQHSTSVRSREVTEILDELEVCQ